MIDKGLYRKNFSVGGRDGPASGDAPGPGDTGGEGGFGKDTNQFGGKGSSPTSTGGGDNQFAAPGTLSDPREKLDYFGPTRFGPARKFTGSFLDNILGSGYRPVTPTGQFQSRFSQMGGLGKGILGGLISLINPVAGLAYRGIDKLGALRDYDNLADYAKGEFGLFQDEDEDEIDTIDIRDKFNRLGITTPVGITNTTPGLNFINAPQNIEGYNTITAPSANPQEYDFFSNAMAKLNQVEQRAYDTLKMGKELGINTEKQNKQLEELEQKKNESSLMTGLA